MSDVIAKEMDEALQKPCTGPMTEKEIALLRDVASLVEFAIRNGWLFRTAIGAIGHDMNGIARYRFDLEKAELDGFLPKVTGYSKLTSDSFGDSPEEEPGDE